MNLEEMSKRESVDSVIKESKFSHIEPEVVLELLEQGCLPKDIAKIYGCTEQTLRKHMKKRGYVNYDGREFLKRRDIKTEELIDLYEYGFSTGEIAEFYDAHPNTISNRLKSKRVKLNKSYSPRKDITSEECCRLYFDEKMSLRDIGKKLECSDSIVFYRIKQSGRTLRKRSHPELRKDITSEECCRLYFDEGMSSIEVAEKLECSIQTIFNRIKQSGRTSRKKGQALNHNNFYKLLK